MSGYTLFSSNKSLAINCLALLIPFVLLETIPLGHNTVCPTLGTLIAGAVLGP